MPILAGLWGPRDVFPQPVRNREVAELKVDAKRAALDEKSGFWPTSYALTDPTEKAWEQLSEIVQRAAEV